MMWEETVSCPFCNSKKKQTKFEGIGPIHGHGVNKLGETSSYSCCCGNCGGWFNVVYQYYNKNRPKKTKPNKINIIQYCLEYDKYVEFTKDNKEQKKHLIKNEYI